MLILILNMMSDSNREWQETMIAVVFIGIIISIIGATLMEVGYDKERAEWDARQKTGK